MVACSSDGSCCVSAPTRCAVPPVAAPTVPVGAVRVKARGPGGELRRFTVAEPTVASTVAALRRHFPALDDEIPSNGAVCICWTPIEADGAPVGASDCAPLEKGVAWSTAAAGRLLRLRVDEGSKCAATAGSKSPCCKTSFYDDAKDCAPGPALPEELTDPARDKLREASGRGGCGPPRAPRASAGCCGGSTGCGPVASTHEGGGAGGAGSDPPVHHVNTQSSTYTYSGEALRALVLNFGAVGGGCVSLAGDGGLRQWQLSNVVNHVAAVPDSFFAVRCQAEGSLDGAVAASDTSAVLMCDALYDSTGFTPAPMITDADVPQCSIDLLKVLPGVPDLSVKAQFPTAEVSYTMPDAMPLEVATEVISPFIPLDSKNSGMPIVFFNVTVKNNGSTSAVATLMQTQQNIGGWDGESEITDEVCNSGYGGNVNNKVTLSGVTALDMSNTSLRETDDFNGHVAIGILDPGVGPIDEDERAAPAPITTGTMAQADSAAAMWAAFTSSTGIDGKGQTGPSPSGKTWNGAVAATCTLAPGESRTVTFFLSWHFPNRYVNWSQTGFSIDDKFDRFRVGQAYAQVWPTITSILEAAQTSGASLCATTRLFRDQFYDSSLPWYVLDNAAPRASVLRSQTCMWHGDGNFYAFEGCSTTAGCCPLNCTHVWNYEMALSRCFPDLERTMRQIDLQVQIAPNGIVPSRTPVPLVLRRLWSQWPNYTDVSPSSTAICTDGEIGTVLKLYREVRHGAPAKWFAALWPLAKKILDRWMNDLDSKGDGLIWGPQPNTYDCALYGPNSFMSGLYGAALLAGAEMATLQRDSASAAAYRARAAISAKSMDAQLFTTGKWYTQIVDPANPVNELASGAFVDQLLGQWWAHALDLGYVVSEPKNIATAVTNVFTANHRTTFNPADQYPRKFYDSRDAGLYIATWPDGTPPAKPMLYTSEGAWSGIEYPMAGLAVMEGITSVWTTMLTDIAARQDGTRRSPQNQIECGDQYTRPMAGWLLVEAASGQRYSAPAASIKFAPVVAPINAFKSFFSTGSAWGQFAQTGPDTTMATGTVTLSVAYGSLSLQIVELASAATTATAAIGATAVPLKAAAASGVLTLAFDAATTIAASSTLTITLGAS